MSVLSKIAKIEDFMPFEAALLIGLLFVAGFVIIMGAMSDSKVVASYSCTFTNSNPGLDAASFTQPVIEHQGYFSVGRWHSEVVTYSVSGEVADVTFYNPAFYVMRFNSKTMLGTLGNNGVSYSMKCDHSS